MAIEDQRVMPETPVVFGSERPREQGVIDWWITCQSRFCYDPALAVLAATVGEIAANIATYRSYGSQSVGNVELMLMCC